MRYILALFMSVLSSTLLNAQIPGGYSVSLVSQEIPGVVGLHSYSFATANDKWLIIGGRRDGLHARQPFNAFPSSLNNTDIFVIDPLSNEVWTSSVTELSTQIQEQLQASNACFHQMGDTLYIAGGYAYSASAADHITFPSLIAFNIAEVMQDVMDGDLVSGEFKQLTDPLFAVTGGRMAQMGNRLLIVGGHRFDGNYNPMGMPTYTQAYTNAIRSFIPVHSKNSIQITGTEITTNEFHLHRRDYNLIPYLNTDGNDSFYISSGVFQPDANLPYLYPVEIDGTGINPRPEFSQFLSNYHCPTISIYDGQSTHSLFFGGMSQYYYENGSMIQDNQVPFTRTISMFTRDNLGNYTESVLPIEMPGLKGSGAEFIRNELLPQSSAGVVRLNELLQDSILLGYIYGGINSSQLNPFSSNQTSTTSASSVIYQVWLTRNSTTIETLPNVSKWRPLSVFPNPATERIQISFEKNAREPVFYYLLDSNGKLVDSGECSRWENQNELYEYYLPKEVASQQLELVVVSEDHTMWSCTFIVQ